MIYSILTGAAEEYWNPFTMEFIRAPSPLLGAGSTLSGMMWELHLPALGIDNPRTRFWFTERG
jgi:hypothetical protein